MATAFLVAGFLAAGFLVTAFLVADFLAADFLATDFLVAGFLLVLFLGEADMKLSLLSFLNKSIYQYQFTCFHSRNKNS